MECSQTILPDSFEQVLTLNFNHIDNHGIARPSATFDLMQDIATSDALRLGVDKDSLGILWVLSRIHVMQTRPLYPEEPLCLTTCCDGVKGVTWCRSFSISVAGQQIVRAYSTWAMLDPIKHRIVRPSTLEIPRFPEPGASFLFPGKLSCTDLHPHHTHTVRYSDLDRNNHLNNAKIVDFIADALDFDRLTGQFISDIQVNYLAECNCGEEILLSTREGNGCIFVSGKVNDTCKFEAVLRLKKQE